MNFGAKIAEQSCYKFFADSEDFVLDLSLSKEKILISTETARGCQIQITTRVKYA